MRSDDDDARAVEAITKLVTGLRLRGDTGPDATVALYDERTASAPADAVVRACERYLDGEVDRPQRDLAFVPSLPEFVSLVRVVQMGARAKAAPPLPPPESRSTLISVAARMERKREAMLAEGRAQLDAAGKRIPLDVFHVSDWPTGTTWTPHGLYGPRGMSREAALDASTIRGAAGARTADPWQGVNYGPSAPPAGRGTNPGIERMLRGRGGTTDERAER